MKDLVPIVKRIFPALRDFVSTRKESIKVLSEIVRKIDHENTEGTKVKAGSKGAQIGGALMSAWGFAAAPFTAGASLAAVGAGAAIAGTGAVVGGVTGLVIYDKIK